MWVFSVNKEKPTYRALRWIRGLLIF